MAALSKNIYIEITVKDLCSVPLIKAALGVIKLAEALGAETLEACKEIRAAIEQAEALGLAIPESLKADLAEREKAGGEGLIAAYEEITSATTLHKDQNQHKEATDGTESPTES